MQPAEAFGLMGGRVEEMGDNPEAAALALLDTTPMPLARVACLWMEDYLSTIKEECKGSSQEDSSSTQPPAQDTTRTAGICFLKHEASVIATIQDWLKNEDQLPETP